MLVVLTFEQLNPFSTRENVTMLFVTVWWVKHIVTHVPSWCGRRRSCEFPFTSSAAHRKTLPNLTQDLTIIFFHPVPEDEWAKRHSYDFETSIQQDANFWDSRGLLEHRQVRIGFESDTAQGWDNVGHTLKSPVRVRVGHDSRAVTQGRAGCRGGFSFPRIGAEWCVFLRCSALLKKNKIHSRLQIRALHLCIVVHVGEDWA